METLHSRGAIRVFIRTVTQDVEGLSKTLPPEPFEPKDHQDLNVTLPTTDEIIVKYLADNTAEADVSVQGSRVVIPGIRAILRHAWPTIIIGKVIPVVLFLGFFTYIGVTSAIVVALAWSLGVVAYQRMRGQRVAGLVLMSVIGNTAKTIVALLTGSLFVYFVQPTISTTLIGIAFLISVPLGFPMAERLIRDFCPFDEETSANPELNRFFSIASLLWAATSLLNGAVTLYLLLTQSVTSFVILKSFLGPATTGLTLVVGMLLFKIRMERAGVAVEFASHVSAGATRA